MLHNQILKGHVMRKLALLSFLCLICAGTRAEELASSTAPTDRYPSGVSKKYRPKSIKYNFRRWAVHSNLLGFVQFGPSISADYFVSRHIALDAHARFTSLGALRSMIYSADVDRGGRPDKLAGIAFGGGPLYFFDVKKDKAYTGILFEYEMTDALYLEDYFNEWSQDNRKMLLMLNTGYRFRFAEKIIPGPHRRFDKFFRKSFFLNTGVYIGAEKNNFRWDYNDPNAGAGDMSPREGSKIMPFGMLEVSVGLEF